MHYMLHESHPFHPNPGPVEPQRAETWADMLTAVEDLTGRAHVLGFASVRRKLREGNRCAYIASQRGKRAVWVVSHEGPKLYPCTRCGFHDCDLDCAA
jgi:hypothetical protein